MNGMGGYVGSSEDQRRIRRQQKEREEQRRQFTEAQAKLEASAPALRRFDTSNAEAVELAFKTQTVGLVTREEFQERRQNIIEQLNEEKKRARDAAAEKARVQRDAKKARADLRQRLSFDDDFDEEDDTINGEGKECALDATTGIQKDEKCLENGNHKEGSPKIAPGFEVGKDPTVKADFLPDRERERKEEELREQLRREWEERQKAVKEEPLEITYSYWNGSGHRRTVMVKKGDTVGTFLKAALEQVAPRFRELRHASTSSLMYVKEDVILPHALTFYELIASRAQGRSGPLFQFDLQEHAATKFDPRMKSQDSHAGKVVERHWYSRHKHIFPYSRWEVYDEEKHSGVQKIRK